MDIVLFISDMLIKVFGNEQYENIIGSMVCL